MNLKLFRSEQASFYIVLMIGLFLSHTLSARQFAQLNLVSDIPGFARNFDSHLVNPWGLVSNKNGSIQVANNGTGTSTAYTPEGDFFPNSVTPLVINIPGPGNVGTGTPTGIALNRTNHFLITKNLVTAPATYIFATEDGTIAAWNPLVDPLNAIIVVNNSGSGAVYKGISLAKREGVYYLYVTNFHDNLVEVYDQNFAFVQSFTDPNVDTGFAPFGIRVVDEHIYVTFAKQDINRHDDVAGPGNGYVDVVTHHNTLRRVISKGKLNSPWGLEEAPKGFGYPEDTLLVGNFGDGHINAYKIDEHDGDFIETLKDIQGTILTISGLWGLNAGHVLDENDCDTLYFTAGPDDESHGLFGKIKHVKHHDE